jgi:signal transduction histidine kinase/ligand-binding sensor domain-containing protein/DNA-binding response OmpR family regulator
MRWSVLLFVTLVSQISFGQGVRFNKVIGHGEFDNSSITAIAEDYLGRMWFGSREGLHLYDATSIRSFHSEIGNEQSLTTNWIQCLREDSLQNLWIGTDNGLNKMSMADFSVQRYNLSDFGSRGNSILDIYVDKNGIVWVSSFGGLYYYQTDENRFRKLNIASVDQDFVINHIFKNNDDELVLVTNNSGLYTIDVDDFSIAPLFTHQLQQYEIRNAVQDDNNNYWLATKSDGMILFNGQEAKRFKPTEVTHNILQVFSDQSGVYALSDGDGLYHIDPKKHTLARYRIADEVGITSNVLVSVYKDSRNTIWFGMINSGVCYLDKYSSVFTHHLSQMEHSSLKRKLSILDALALDRDNLLLATDGEGLVKININTGDTTKIALGNIRVVKKLYRDNNGFIWGGTYQDGLICLDKNLTLIKHYSKISSQNGNLVDDSVWALKEDYSGNFWIGTLGSGLFLFDTKEEIFYSCKEDLEDFKLDESVITTIYIDNTNKLYVGTKEGLMVYDEQSKRFNSFNTIAKPLSNNTIRQVYEDQDMGMWICTENGLNHWKNGELTVYSKENGLSASRIQGIVEDKNGRLWVASTYGLNLGIDSTHYRTLLMEDGLSSNNINTEGVILLPDNRVLLLTLNGITLFDPDKIKTNQQEPEVVFSDLWINGQIQNDFTGTKTRTHISSRDKIKFKYEERFFSIGFSALNYNWPSKNKYSYLLEGYSEQWIEGGNLGRATFTNLTPGDYVFKVKAANNDGLWNNQTKELVIEVMPPWWDTWWANLIYFSVLVGIIYFFRAYIVKGEIYKHTIRTKELEVKRKEELEKLKDQFFTNISHDIRTPLSLIVAPISSLINSEEKLSQNERHNVYQTIKRNCDSLLRLVNQLLDYRKLELGKLKLRVKEINLSELMHEMVQRFATTTYSNQNYTIKVEAEENVTIAGDYLLVENIFYNLISNAIKHSNKAEVEIILGCKKVEDEVEFWVKDNGEGISSSNMKRIFDRFYQGDHKGYGSGIGLSYVKELVDVHKGTISVESSSEWGTKFILRWPAAGQQFDGKPIEDIDDIEVGQLMSEASENANDTNLTDHSKKPKIIIAEDNDDLRNYLNSEFQGTYKIKLAANGAEALKLVDTFFPDLIISDVMMPEMDGNELCKKVKSKLATSHIPVLLLTAKTTDEHQLEGIESGADGYITKPFNIDLLRKKVEKTIEIRNQLRKRFSQLPEVDPQDLQMSEADKKLLTKLNAYIDKNIQETELSIESVAEELGLSRGHFHKKMKALTDASPSEYIRTIRLKKAAELLRLRKYSIEEVSYEVGFSSPSYFSRSFNNFYGVSPSKYIQTDKD